MRIWITDKKGACRITLREWRGENMSCNFFDDMATDLPTYYPVTEPGVDAAAQMTLAEYADTVKWWLDEVSAYNEGLPNVFTDGVTPQEYAEEYGLDIDKFADEMLLDYDWFNDEPLPAWMN